MLNLHTDHFFQASNIRNPSENSKKVNRNKGRCVGVSGKKPALPVDEWIGLGPKDLGQTQVKKNSL